MSGNDTLQTQVMMTLAGLAGTTAAPRPSGESRAGNEACIQSVAPSPDVSFTRATPNGAAILAGTGTTKVTVSNELGTSKPADHPAA